MKHLSLDQLGKLRQGSLAGAELLAADDHLTVCPECRAQLAALAPVAFLDEWAGNLAESDASHLPYEVLQSYVDGQNSQADQMRIETHLAACPSCRAEADDLKQFAAQYRARHTGAERYKRYLIFGPLAAALIVGAILIPRAPRAPELAVSLQDGGKKIGLDQQGRLVGPDAGSLEHDLIASALQNGAIAVTFPEGLRGKKSVLLGAGAPAPPFQVLSPVGQAVLNPAVEFRWDALQGATTYQVQVFDTDYQPVAGSPKQSGTSWISQPLARGKQYVWQVTAFRGDSTVKAPQPPDPEARFLVIADQDANAIERAREARAGHLRMTVLYARAGLCREATAELDALARENNNAPLANQLRSSLAASCEAAPR